MDQTTTYTAAAKSESVGVVKTVPPYMVTSSGTGTGSGNTQVAANIAAEEAAKRASRTALDTVQNITEQVWKNLTTGFKKEFPIEDIECYITFDQNYIYYAGGDGTQGNAPIYPTPPTIPDGYFWQGVFSGYVYKVNTSPDNHFENIGSNFGNIQAFISGPVLTDTVQEYTFNITVDSTIHSDITKNLVKDKTYNFTSKMSWIGTFNTRAILPATAPNPYNEMETVVLGILNDDLPDAYNYNPVQTDITLNGPGLALNGLVGADKKIVLNGEYDFVQLPHAVVQNNTLLDATVPPKTVYKIGSNFDRSFVGTAPVLDEGLLGSQLDIEDRLVVTELGKQAKK